MARTPNIKVNISPTVDTDKIDAMKATFQAMGEGLAKMGAEMKPALDALVKPFQQKLFEQNVLTQQQVCLAYGIPPESIGLMAPDALDGVKEAIESGTLTSEVADDDWTPPWVLALANTPPLANCPSNTAPYVEGQLGINAKLVSQQPTGWHEKTTEQILADIQQAANTYKTLGKTPVPDPVKPVVNAKGIKIAKLDPDGNATEWTDMGGVVSMDLSFASSAKALAASDTFAKAVATEKLDQMAQTEMQVLSSFLGVDVGKGSGNVVTIEKAPADLKGPLQITVTGPEGEPVMQTTVPQSTVYALIDAAYQAFEPPVVGQVWHHDFTKPIGQAKLSDHASGMAVDFNGQLDHMHFEVGSLATGEPINLGHTEAVAEAQEKHKALKEWHAKVKAKAEEIKANDGIMASGGLIAPLSENEDLLGFGSIPYPEFPAVPTVQKGGVKYPTPKHGPTGATCIPLGDGKSEVQLSGLVSLGAKGNFSLAYSMILPDEFAEMLVGFKPIPEGVALTMPIQYAAGEMFVWNTQKGWQPHKAPEEWFGEDGQPLVSTAPGKAKTTLSGEERTWCIWHEQHWADPTHMAGLVFECGSSQFSRPSTPLEDKQVLARLRMLHDTGLA